MSEVYNIKIDEKKCSCRLWNKGFSSQCKSNKTKGSPYCKAHYTKTNEGKELWGFGLITDRELPKNHLSDYPEKEGKPLPWKINIKDIIDGEIICNYICSTKEKNKCIENIVKKTTRKQRTCSICGKPGHDKRKCNTYNITNLDEKEQIVPKKEEHVPKKEEPVPKKGKSIDKSDYIEPYMISYQGVSYIYNENKEKSIINSKTEIVGKWDDNKIIWNSKEYEKEHIFNI